MRDVQLSVIVRMTGPGSDEDQAHRDKAQRSLGTDLGRYTRSFRMERARRMGLLSLALVGSVGIGIAEARQVLVRRGIESVGGME